MVNNSITINKTNNHLSPNLVNIKMTTTYDVGNPSHGLEQIHKSAKTYVIAHYNHYLCTR
jgi:hypothetical protein